MTTHRPPPAGFVLDVLRVFADYELCEFLYWNCEDDGISFFVSCNDLFHWGTADAEDITPESLPLLEQSLKDVEEIDYALGGYGVTLYCCRRRGMRPQGASYDKDATDIWPLFDACGPEREVGFGNPKARP